MLSDLGNLFDTRVFLGGRGGGSEFLRPDEMLAPDEWVAIMKSFIPSPAAVHHYSKFAGSQFFSTAMQDIYKAMERRDYSGTFRSLDKEVVSRILILFYISKFLEHEIEGVVFDISPHTPDSMIVYQVAKILRVPTLAFEVCGIAPVRFAVTEMTSKNRFYTNEASISTDNFRNFETAVIIEKALEDSWRGFKDLDHVQNYVVAQRTRSRKKSILSWGRWRNLVSRLSSESGSVSMAFFGSDWSVSARAIIGWFLEKSLRARLARAMDSVSLAVSSSGLAGLWGMGASDGKERALPMNNSSEGQQVNTGDAALFALHYEPESTSFPQGIPVRNQLDAVIEARRLLGGSKKLLVKEHPTQLLEANAGYMGRSNLFYPTVQALPDTVLVPDWVPAKKIMGLVDVVFTLTGTVAFEGLVQGKHIIYFGSPWWEGCPGTVKALIGSRFEQSNPVLSLDSDFRSEAWTFALQKVLGQGIFYPDEIANLDEVARARPELTAILSHWLQDLSCQIGSAAPKTRS